MTMTYIWTAIAVVSLIFGVMSGNISQIGTAALEGAQKAVELSFSLCGVMCIWTGVMELFKKAGALNLLSRLLKPVLSILFSKKTCKESAETISANMAANMMGLGNAATPLGIQAACSIVKSAGSAAANDLCMLVVINTASIQLIPTNIAALRASAGSAAPFDILPAVWITSLISVSAGVAAAKLLAKIWKN